MEHWGGGNNTAGRRWSDFSRLSLGCPRPRVDFPDAVDEELLSQLQNNDPEIEGVRVGSEDWIEGIGHTIGDNEYLRKIKIQIFEQPIGQDSWLDDLLHGLSLNRSIEWLSLNLLESELDLRIDELLTSFIKFNFNLRGISFHEDISTKTFNHLTSLLSACNNCRFECIEITSIDSTDDQATMFFNSLNRHRKLLELAFVGPNIGRVGCTALANLLTNPASKIVKLRLGANDFDDYSISVLSNALIYRNTLISLSFSGKLNEPTRITNEGWRAFFAIFSRPSCSIEDLFLHRFPLGDEFVTHLGDALTNNQTLKYLHVGESISFSLEGWKYFASCFKNPYSALEELNLLGCGIDSGGIVAILTALAGNWTLKRLNVNLSYIVENAEVLSHLLCDKTNIDSTHSSNHTMNSIHWPHNRDPIPGVSSYLTMNKNKNKSEVARRKILIHHFSGEVAASCALSCMPETDFPYALSWICIDDFGYSAMYHVVRAFPSLFANPNNARKRRKCR